MRASEGEWWPFPSLSCLVFTSEIEDKNACERVYERGY